MKGPVALVDCNNFYASCERVFNPALRNKPIVVLSNNDGMIIARSNEAKEIGVKMGEPLFKIKPFIKKHDVRVFSSNYTLYGDMSRRVMDTLEQFSPDVEIYSIDEAFVSLEGINGNLNDYASEIRETVYRWTGIPVSVGVARTKTLAKIANRYAKKHPECNGALNISDAPDIDKYLKWTDVSDVWGIGRQYSKLLNKNGINNAWELSKANEYWVKKKMTVMGLRTVLELRGISCIEMEYTPPAKKAIVSSRSFGRYVTELNDLKEAISLFTSKAAEKMRQQKSAATLLAVFLRTNPFRKEKPQYHNGCQAQMPVPASSTSELLFYAMKSLEQIYREGYEYQKVGVMLSGLVPHDSSQMSLFETEDRKRMARITEIVDKVNAIYGRETIFHASSGTGRNWNMRRDKLSGRYTTNWGELPEAKAGVIESLKDFGIQLELFP